MDIGGQDRLRVRYIGWGRCGDMGGGMTGYRKAYVCGFRDALMYSQWRLREAGSPADNCIHTSLSRYSPVAYVAHQSVEEAPCCGEAWRHFDSMDEQRP